MAKFFDFFPVIPYDISGEKPTNYQVVRNIFFRVKIIRSIISNISSYYEYIVQDGDKPEVLADKVYGDPEAHWIILMANEMIDAAYDWPLDYDKFKKYLVKKYENDAYVSLNPPGLLTDAQVIAWTQTNYHHYEKVIQRTESLSGITTETRFVINDQPYTFSQQENYGIKHGIKHEISAGEQAGIILASVTGTFFEGDYVQASDLENTFQFRVKSYDEETKYMVLECTYVFSWDRFNTNQNIGMLYKELQLEKISQTQVFPVFGGPLHGGGGGGTIVYVENPLNPFTPASAKIETVVYPKGVIRFYNFDPYMSYYDNLFKPLEIYKIPYFSYDDLARTQYVQTFNMGYEKDRASTSTLTNAGRSVYEVSFGEGITFYDYEKQLNEAKRTIKIIKPEYYPQIVDEFNKLTNYASSPYLRKLTV